jgi:hypothetical protein
LAGKLRVGEDTRFRAPTARRASAAAELTCP